MNLVVSFRRVSAVRDDVVTLARRGSRLARWRVIQSLSLTKSSLYLYCLSVSTPHIGPFSPAQSVAAMFADVFVPQASGYVLV